MSEVADIPDLLTRREALKHRLAGFRRHIIRHLLFAGMARILAEVVLVCILSLFIDRWLRLSVPTRVVLLIAGLIGLAYEIRRWILQPLSIGQDHIGMVAAIDRRQGNRNGQSLAPRVATVLELPELLRRPSAPSAAMIERAVVRADDALREVNFEGALDDRRHKLNFRAIIAILVIASLLIALNAGTFGLWARRWFAASSEPWPQKTYLSVHGLTDGRIIVPRGEPYTLRLMARTPQSTIIPEEISLRLREGKGTRTSASMTKFGENDFRFDLPAVQTPITIEARGGDDEVEPFVIEPVDRPRIVQMMLLAQHPTEDQPTTYDFAGEDADLSFLPRTKMRLEFEANVAIAHAQITNRPAQERQVADRKFVIEWTHDKPESISIELTSYQAGLTSLATPVTIGLKVDQPPRVSLSFTGVRQRITPMAKIPLTILARDDSGISTVELSSKAEFLDAEKKPQALTTDRKLFGPVDRATEMEIQRKETFDVTGMKLLPGTILALTAGASDQRYESPQVGSSRPATFRIVSPEELFREILLRQQGERAKFRKQIDEATKIRDTLGTLSGAESAPPLARQHRNIQREAQRIGTALAESIQEMRLNGLGTAEAYDLMERNVLSPLRELDRELMIPQRDALDALASQKIEDVIARQEQIVTRMQQILKQMSQWDSFVDVLNQLNEIIRMQEAVKVGTDSLKTKQTKDVFDE